MRVAFLNGEEVFEVMRKVCWSIVECACRILGVSTATGKAKSRVSLAASVWENCCSLDR